MPDSSRCREIIMSEDYADFITEYTSTTEEFEEENKDYCPQIVGYRYALVYERTAMILPINPQVYSYRSVPKLYGEMDTQAVESTGSMRLQNLTGLNLDGSGVIIGVIDSGIDYMNEAFRYSSGDSRIVSIWDQSDNSGNTPEDFDYGTEYSQSDINGAIRSDNPYDIVKSRDVTGHGTFMAGVAAGSENVQQDFIGAAPEAKIVVVKLKQAKKYLRDYYFIDENAVAYQENDIMAGIRYVERAGVKYRMPVVMCLGIGSSQGAHSGESYLETLINELAGRVGICVVAPTGNEGNARHHYQGRISSTEYVNVEMRADRSFTAELWGQSPDLFSVSIISPTGEVVPRIPAKKGQSDILSFIFENTKVYVDYRIVEQRTGAQLILMRFENPSVGIWRIQVYGDNITVGSFHIWLPITEFVGNGTYFLSPEPDVTLTAPSSSLRCITTGGYNSRNNTFYIDSGRGFNRDGARKPDITSPCVNVFGPVPGGGYQNRTGTSVAAALTAGASAQLLQWGFINRNDTNMNSQDIKNYLIRGADRSRDIVYPSEQWGWGTLNVYDALDILR